MPSERAWAICLNCMSVVGRDGKRVANGDPGLVTARSLCSHLATVEVVPADVGGSPVSGLEAGEGGVEPSALRSDADPNALIPGPDPGACPHCGGWRKAGMTHRCADPEDIAETAWALGYRAGRPMALDAWSGHRSVWEPVEAALVAQDRISGRPEDNHDPEVHKAPEPKAVARAVLEAAAALAERVAGVSTGGSEKAGGRELKLTVEHWASVYDALAGDEPRDPAMFREAKAKIIGCLLGDVPGSTPVVAVLPKPKAKAQGAGEGVEQALRKALEQIVAMLSAKNPSAFAVRSVAKDALADAASGGPDVSGRDGQGGESLRESLRQADEDLREGRTESLPPSASGNNGAHLTVEIHREEDGAYYSAIVQAPGCFASGDSVLEVLANTGDAFELWSLPKAKPQAPLSDTEGREP